MNDAMRAAAMWAAVVLSSVGCGMAAEGPTAEDKDQLDSAGAAQSATTGMLALADSFFDFDPVLDPTKTAEANAQAVGATITTKLAGCGAVTVSGTTVTANFGAPPGCTLSTGLQVSGAVSLAVTKTGTTLNVALTFTQLVVDGTALAGTASFTTSNGSTFQVTANLTTGAGAAVVNLTVVGQPASFVLDGTTALTEGGRSTTLTFTQLHAAAGQCYADRGAMGVVKGSLTSSVAFNAQTPSTGVVQVTQGRRTFPATLPAYGSCPRSPDAGK